MLDPKSEITVADIANKHNFGNEVYVICYASRALAWAHVFWGSSLK